MTALLTCARARWIEDVNACGPADVGQAFGLTFRERPTPGNLSPCPACTSEKRHPSRHDRRGAIGLTRDGGGWRCFECDAHGDAVTLAAWITAGRIPTKGDPAWRDVRAACAREGLCSSDPRSGVISARCRSAPISRAPEPLQRLPSAEVLGAWQACRPVTEDTEVSAWLKARGLEPGRVEDADLARALPPGPAPASWMRFAGQPWDRSSHRVIVPLYAPSGALESLHARALAPREANGRDKAASPAGASVCGLVMADPAALSMLRGLFQPAALVIVEGEPDFLTWASLWSDADEDAPAVLGIIAGSWTDEIAAYVAPGIPVALRTHRDHAGNRYARRISDSLSGRCTVHWLAEAAP